MQCVVWVECSICNKPLCWGSDSFQYYTLSISTYAIPQSAPSRIIVLISWEWTTSLQCAVYQWHLRFMYKSTSIQILLQYCGFSISAGFSSSIGISVVYLQCYLSCCQIAIFSSIVWPHKTRTAYKAGIKRLFWLILTHKNSWLPLYLSIAFR